MNTLTAKLNSLGVDPADLPEPGGSYVSLNVRGNIAYIAIQFPIANGEFLFQGRLGQELSTGQGYEATRLAAINVLKQVNHYLDFEQVEGLNHFDFYYRAVNGWDEAPKVANGASDVFVELLGEQGKHTRAIFGVADLPRNFSIGLTATFTLYPEFA